MNPTPDYSARYVERTDAYADARRRDKIISGCLIVALSAIWFGVLWAMTVMIFAM